MSKWHKGSSTGMDDRHIGRMVDAMHEGDPYAFEATMRTVKGGNRGVKAGAQAVVANFLRDGGELPVPNLDREPAGYTALRDTLRLIEVA